MIQQGKLDPKNVWEHDFCEVKKEKIYPNRRWTSAVSISPLMPCALQPLLPALGSIPKTLCNSEDVRPLGLTMKKNKHLLFV